MKRITVAFIGMGYRGKQLLRLINHIPFYHVVAIADPAMNTEEYAVSCYTQGTEDYRRMLAEHHPQLVFIVSPWQLHVTHATDCLQAGCDVALEIKGGLYLNEYQPVLEWAEKLKKRIFPLENTLFKRDVLAVKQLTEAGELGEIVYMRGGYRHDLRDLLLDDNGLLGNRQNTESVWRSQFYLHDNGDLYPTHGLAPLCFIANLSHLSQLHSLTASASKAIGLMHRAKELGNLQPLSITQGDVVVSQIKTHTGILISLTHDTTLPRPRSLDLEIQGTKGIWQGDTHRIYLEGKSPQESWESDESYLTAYEHPYWQKWGKEALQIDAHHQGMDYVMLKALEADYCGESKYPADGYNLALWTAVTPLSKQSIAEARSVIVL